LIIPNAGADELTGPLCAPNVFRSSFSAWQPAYAMGKIVAERAVKAGVTEVVFDRGPYIYHGRVKALAEAAREGGLSF